MTKQQEIKEGIEKFVSEAYWYEGEKNIVADITDRLVRYLHDNGVVRKSDKNFRPTVEWDMTGDTTLSQAETVSRAFREAYNKAGFVAVESLIDE